MTTLGSRHDNRLVKADWAEHYILNETEMIITRDEDDFKKENMFFFKCKRIRYKHIRNEGSLDQ